MNEKAEITIQMAFNKLMLLSPKDFSTFITFRKEKAATLFLFMVNRS